MSVVNDKPAIARQAEADALARNVARTSKAVQQAIYRTGFCQVGHHAHCRGTIAGVDCCCSCHRKCKACGQTLPAVPHG